MDPVTDLTPEATSTPDSAPAFDGLVSEMLGPTPAPASPEAGAPGIASETPAAAPSEPAPSAPAAPMVEEPKFNFNGRIFTQSDLLKDPDLMRALVTTANQGPHYAGLYNQLLDQVRAYQQRPPQQPSQTPTVPSGQLPTFKNADEAKLHYKEQVQQLIDVGWIEPDFAEFAPGAVSGFMWLRDQVTDARMALLNMLQMAQGYVEETRGGQIRSEVDTLIGGLKERGGFYADLGEKARVEAFRDWILGTGVIVGKLRDPEFLAQQYLAFNHNNFAQIASAAVASDKARQAEEARRRQRARGEGGGGSRPSAAAPAEPNPWDAVVDGVLSGG